jgi:ribosomal-protein-alanine N-acetyltransferase
MKRIVVATKRLCIMPQSMEELTILYEKELDLDMKKAYRDMMETMRLLPGKEEWGSNWKINLASGLTIGGIGFKGAPDAEGTVEIGYGIDEEYRGNGYATEAVNGLMKWALEQKGVRCITAQTEPGNDISQKVLLNNGFVRDGYGEEGPLYKITL